MLSVILRCEREARASKDAADALPRVHMASQWLSSFEARRKRAEHL
jgi:hypothetical protein